MFRDLAELIKQQPFASAVLAFFLTVSCWFLINGVSVAINSQAKEDSIIVLGGSVAREVFAAVLAKREPNHLTIVSGGEPPNCTRRIFANANAPVENVVLDRSARSTFENYTYSLPLLKRFHARKTGVITSEGHEQRAVWMARIFLWSNGIAVDNKIIPGDFSQSGHAEDPLKTMLDVIRSIAWAPVTNIFAPQGDVVMLKDVSEDTNGCNCQPVPAELVDEYEKALDEALISR